VRIPLYGSVGSDSTDSDRPFWGLGSLCMVAESTLKYVLVLAHVFITVSEMEAIKPEIGLTAPSSIYQSR
jgi:hypothetical protein